MEDDPSSGPITTYVVFGAPYYKPKGLESHLNPLRTSVICRETVGRLR